MHLLYRRGLEGAGYTLLLAKNGREALEIAAREGPDLIFMDVMMPQVDGLTALRELKKSDVTKDIPVVVITSNVSEYAASRQESETSGATAFLSKPLSPGRLLEEVRRLLAPPPPTQN
jgi:CheY-like chemotaxis protein